MIFLSNYAALNNYNGPDTCAYLLGGISPGDGCEGFWNLNTSYSSTAVPDIGVTQRDANMNMWKRSFSGGINPYWYKSSSSDTDDVILQRAINASVAMCLPGVSIPVTPPGGSLFTFTKSINIPSYAQLIGTGKRSFVCNYNGNGSAFVVAGAQYAKLSGFRIGLGTSNTAVALDVHTTTGNTVRWCKFQELEIAGSSVAGQIGIKAFAYGNDIVTGNTWEDINTFGVDQPIQRSNIEGNFWRGITIEEWGYSPNPIALNSTANAEFFEGRIAGAPKSSFTAITEGGNRNLWHLVVDCGSSGHAVNIGGTANAISLRRPELLTPFGWMASGNFVLGES